MKTTQDLALTYGEVPNPGAEFNAFEARVGLRGVDRALTGEHDKSISATTNILANTSNPRLELVATLMASGKTRKEIAEILGIAYSTVINLSNQPYVRTRMTSLLKENGGNVVKAFLNGQVMSSVETLVEIRDGASNRPADRAAAANAILDRALGKPTQHIETSKGSDIDDAAMEVASLNLRIAENNARLRAAGVSLPN